MSIIGGANNPLGTLSPNILTRYSLTPRSVLSRIDQNFGHEHAVYIRYLHESGISDIEIVERIWTTFADKFIVAPGVSDERREKDLKGKVAVYTCKWADIEARKCSVMTSV